MQTSRFGSFLTLLASATLASAQGPAPPRTPAALAGATSAPVYYPEAIARPTAAPQPPLVVPAAGGFESGGVPQPWESPFCCACVTNIEDNRPRFWVGADYLTWWVKGSDGPPLLTASLAGSRGILGQPGTLVLVDGSTQDLRDRSGARLSAGWWFTDDRLYGISGNYFFLGARSHDIAAGSLGAAHSLAIARPFFNATTGQSDAHLVALPNTLAGAAVVAATSRLQGGEANLLCHYCTGSINDYGFSIDALAGFRYLQLNEGLAISESTLVHAGIPVLGGTTSLLADQFDTRNYFYGGQVGLQAGLRHDRLDINLLGKLALGCSDQTADRRGQSLLTSGAGTSTQAVGGLLVAPSNFGSSHRNRFAVVPELGINLGWHLTDHLRVSLGYTFLYWSNVARPGDQIDRFLSPGGVPSPGGVTRPLPLFKDTDFWAQGINFGLEFGF